MEYNKEELKRILSSSPEDMADAQAKADRMIEFSNKILDNIAEFAKESVDVDGWPISMLMGLARATSIAVSGLERTHDSNEDIMKYYTNHILPLCHLITQKHEMKEVMNSEDTN